MSNVSFDILRSFRIDSNFWDENPEFLVIKEFKEFHKNDKSKAKNISSTTMWAICLLEHPKSKFSNVGRSKRIEIITEDFISAKNWVDKYEKLIEKFKEIALSRIQRIVSQWADKIDERIDVISKTEYTLENAKEMDDMMSRTEKILNVYNKVLKEMDTEEAKGETHGGGEESLIEKGAI